MKAFATTLLLFICINLVSAQGPGYTANDTIVPYNGHFRPGSNLGYFPPWDDTELADIAAGNPAVGVDGAGVRSIRPSLPEEFLENWGYDYRLDSYQHYFNLDLQDLTNIVGFPADWHRDPTHYCPDYQSEMFDNLYDPIWDNGENGTPINDDNYLALYIYKVVQLYGDYISFWEIWNEPGFDYTGAHGWLPPGAPGNWWENNPDPCHYKLRAPIFHYVRTLRVCYEVIKSEDPDALVTVAGLGFPAFLDAILRNTDNPADGSVTGDYPLGGGAYFDVMGFHSYPHIDGSLRYWDNDIFDFVYTRHSDAAADGILSRRAKFQNVLDNYGYDGTTYPKKHYIVTEINVPRRSFDEDNFGDDEVQVNWIIKAFVQALRNNIYQMHVFNLAETTDYVTAQDEFDLLGLYEKVTGDEPYDVTKNDEAIAYTTSTELLYKSTYDQTQTDSMDLPDGVRGAAFLNMEGNYVYVVWAETTIDSSEFASATYSFPADMGINTLEQREWDFSETDQVSTIGSTSIDLDATPIFLTDNSSVVVPPTPGFMASATVGCTPLTVTFTNQSSANATSYIWSFPGGTPSSATVANPIITYNTPGNYDVTLVVSNAAGSNTLVEAAYVSVESEPDTDFSVSVDDLDAFFANNTDYGDTYSWDFGDGNSSSEANPTHTYLSDGNYVVVLTATNACGTTTYEEIVEISSGTVTAPTAAFSANITEGCAPLTVNYTNLSSPNSTSWNWSFPGGSPSSSTEQNPPTVTYNTPGTYTVILVATNSAGNSTSIETDYIVANTTPTAAFSTNTTGSMVSFSNTSTNATSYEWIFGDGNSSNETFPSHTYNMDGTYLVTLIAYNDCGASTASQNVVITSPPLAAFTADITGGCAPLMVSYTDQSSANADSWNWSFPGGTPATSTEQNPVVEYTTAGNYSAILTVSNVAGANTAIQTDYITISDTPTADFSTNISGNNVTFINASTGADSYSWDFGDGSVSDLLNPAHTYIMDGTYTVELTVSNDCGTATTTQTIVIGTAPQADFSADVQTGCAPLTVNYSDASSDNTTDWDWSFPGGTPSNSSEQNPTVTYDAAGTYNVTLVVSNATGSSTAQQNSYIVISDVPAAGFTFNSNGNNYNFFNSSTGATSYEWDFGDNNMSTDENPNHTYANDGTYTVTLTATNGCGSTTTTQTVTVITLPVAAFTADTTFGCAPLTVTYSDLSSSNTTSWNWSFPGGTPATSTEQNPVVTYSSGGAYNVSLEATNAGGSDIINQFNYIIISEAPTADFSTIVNGLTVNFSNGSVGATQYDWNFGDTNTSMEQNPQHIYTEPGTYNVELTATNSCGTSVHFVSVVVSSPPVVSFTSNITEGCAPIYVYFTDQSSDDVSSWSWTFNGGTPATSTDQNPVVTYDAAGVYNVSLIVTNAGGTATLTQNAYINVTDIPNADFTYDLSDNTVGFTNTSSGADSYLWIFGDSTSDNTNDNQLQHIYPAVGDYNVMLIATNDCGSDTIEQVVSITTTSLNDLGIYDAITIYPNPNDGQFTLVISGASRNQMELSVINVLGQILASEAVDFSSGQLIKQYDLTGWADGAYLLRIESEGSLVYRKIVLGQ